MRTLIALLLATAAWAEVPLDRVQWLAEFGTPTSVGLAGRAKYVLLFDRKDPGASGAHDRFAWYMHNRYTKEPAFAALMVGVDASYGSPSDTIPEVYPRGNDDGGLLRAFAGDRTCVLLVFALDGTLTDLRADVDDQFLHTLSTGVKDATPLVDAGWVTAPLQPHYHWFLAGDLKKFLAKIPAGDPIGARIATQALEMARADITAMNDAAASGGKRLMAMHRLRGWASEFPPTAAEAGKALKAVKDDAALKAEQAAWAAFGDYLTAMKKVRGKQAAAAQPGLLAALIAKHPDSYAADVAKRIATYAKLTLPEVKKKD